MAVKVELPLALLKEALRGAIALRNRQSNAASNTLIKKALDDEIAVFTTAMNTATETK